jgi:hypothetical protein
MHDQFTATLDIPMEIHCGLDKPSIDMVDGDAREALFEAMKLGLDRVTQCK